jgi:predicted regulator of Ras-like GTPase activity (Roadblock/LC7/MglB family)
MMVIDKNFESALIHLSQSLPFNPRWVGVISVDGVYMGYHGIEPLSEDRVTGLMAAADALHGRISAELINGRFRYAIVGGENGVFVTLSLNDVAVVGMNFDLIPAFDKLLRALPEALLPLLQLLNLK